MVSKGFESRMHDNKKDKLIQVYLKEACIGFNVSSFKLKLSFADLSAQLIDVFSAVTRIQFPPLRGGKNEV